MNKKIENYNTFDLIFIDTSALMNTTWLNKLISINYLDLKASNNKFIVTREVSHEIVKHLTSCSYRKQILAKEVINLLRENKDFFEIEGEKETQKIDPEEYNFADAALLSRLTKNRINKKQILITNDKKLGLDANNLKRSLSCFGHDITVLELKQDGNLVEMEFEKNDFYEQQISFNETIQNENEEKKITTYVATFLFGGLAVKFGEIIWKGLKSNVQ
ncbi:hypothetical protein BI362_11175 [Streptococcus parauberis]|nr:hypothetical protein BI362_11175 [Streptococcus parauberis]